MARTHFKELLNPGSIGPMQLKNRIVMAPMGTYLANRDGTVPERLKSYYAERARGGAGLIVAEIAAVDHPRGRGMTRQLGISEDRFIAGLAELAGAVHRHGAKLAIQLHHAGRIAAPFLSGGFEAVAPSVLPLIPAELGVTRELDLAEIERLIECFARAAWRARQAGLDGVEIHAGHGYLISEFLSRATNRRSDQYGGPLENRARFLLEIIARTRKMVGGDYPVWCRLDGREFSIENGITAAEARETARLAIAAGLDGLHVSGYGGSEGVHFTDAPLVDQPGFLAPLAHEIKKAAGAPVIAVGRISPRLGERMLARGEADFIAFGRALLADPEMPNKLAAAAESEIRPCIHCYSCVHQIFVRNTISCSVNAAVGKESEPRPGRPETIKTVLVAGGGPAGMEAARVAAIRGHAVILYEREKRLGGSLRAASLLRQENEGLIDFLARQLRQNQVRVVLAKSITAEAVARLKPDVVIVATGGAREAQPILGGKSGRVLSGEYLKRWLTAPLPLLRLFSHWWMPLGKNVVILGGGLVACELAWFLVQRGRKVIVLESGGQIAAEMALPLKWLLLDRLAKAGVEILTNVEIKGIEERTVTFEKGEGTMRTIRADSVVDARGIKPDAALAEALKGKAREVYAIGDCSKVSLIKDSIAEANRVASAL
jgi:2,4-dienoyl-CoA reductase-like NADH-dependent reductase (Old Yellow Enzyme family)/NADPH-dependent 2,4-dienoyl-CoA reductase/sulfur reductase-like enzyme